MCTQPMSLMPTIGVLGFVMWQKNCSELGLKNTAWALVYDMYLQEECQPWKMSQEEKC